MIYNGKGIPKEIIYNRLELFAKKIKSEGRKLESIPGLGKQAMANYRNRGNIPASSTLFEWTKLGLSIDWLLTGNGEMLCKQSAQTERRQNEATVGELAQELLLLNQEVRRLREENSLLREQLRDKINPAMPAIGANSAVHL